MSHRHALRAVLLAGAGCAAALSPAALAQEAVPQQAAPEPPAAPEADSAESENRIVVTGSRIARRDFSATSPIVTVDAELFEKSAAINLEANLNKLPQFSPALTQFDTAEIQTSANTTIGIATVSLRQLGSNRNLVLIDGRRGTPVNGTGVVDINSIPSAAVQRVEIITGGASSTYGADAVGGVVNFILKDDFSGLDFDFQGGITERGDGEEYRVSTLVGAVLDGGRGNVMIGLERYKRQEIFRNSRPWYQELDASPYTAGSEFFISDNFISFSGGSPDQAVTNAMFRDLGAPDTVNIPRGSFYINADDSLFINTSSRTADGTYVPLLVNYQGPVDGQFRKITADGILRENNEDSLLSSPQDRWSFFAKGEYEITPDINFVSQAYFARTATRSVTINTVAIGSFGVQVPYNDEIYTGDARYRIASSVLPDGQTHPDYLPGGRYGLNCPAVGGCTNRQVFPMPEMVQTLANSRPDPNAPINVNIVPTAFDRRASDNRTQTFQVLAGFEGSIPGMDWTWDVTASHGETVAKNDIYGLLSADRFAAVVNSPNFGRNFLAVGNEGFGANRNGATATCTTGINPFDDPNSYSDDCNLATRADLQLENRLKQDIVEANLQGGLFELPYGELRFAAGAHWRKNAIDFHADNSSSEGTSFFETINGLFPQGSTKGSTTVKEVYAETLVPILQGLPFVEELNLELGYRYSDYSSVGGVHTFKVNGEYAPTNWLRFRGGYQRASRAPNLGELFTARTQSQTNGLDGDPCSRGNLNNPVVYGNYSANPIGRDSNLNPDPSDTVGNADAAQVEAICRTLMGAEGAAQFYIADRTYPTELGGRFTTSIQAGAEALQEETATTFTIGGVVRSPSDNPWLSRLSLTVDYYNIKLEDGISLQNIDSVYRQCFSAIFNPTFDPNADACQRIGRDAATGNPVNVVVNYANEGRVETSGIDAQLDWGLRFEDAGIPIPGALSINSQFTYLLRFATTSDQVAIPLIDWAGTTGGGEVGTQANSYRWKLFTQFNYAIGAGSIGLQWRHLPKLAHQTAVTNVDGTTIAGAPAYDIFNLSGRYDINENLSVRAGVDNLFDKAPPLLAYDTAADPLNGQLPGGRFIAGYYDTIGRRYYVGIGVSF